MAHCELASLSLVTQQSGTNKAPFLLDITADKTTQDITSSGAYIASRPLLSYDEAKLSSVSCRSRMMPFDALE